MKFVFGILILSFLSACVRNSERVLVGTLSVDGEKVSSTLKLRSVDSSLLIKVDSTGRFYLTSSTESPFFYLEGHGRNADGSIWGFESPLHLPKGTSISLNIVIQAENVRINFDDEINAAIQKFREFHECKMNELWDSPPYVNGLVDWALEYRQEAKMIFGGMRCNAEVKEYLESWKEIEYLNLCKGLRYIFPDDDFFSFPQQILDSVADLALVLDKAYWGLFPNSKMNILFYLQDRENTPEKQIRLLEECFQTPSIREVISLQIISNFVKRTSYSEENLLRLKEMCEGREDQEAILADFIRKAYAFQGALMPDVVFEDVNGNKRSLSDFRGKYLYIDLWASWCAPCCQEMPYMQKIEQTLDNEQVVFVSISIDKNIRQWKTTLQKMKSSGNHWIDVKGDFVKLMDISTIPHFLLYDKQGRLLEYKCDPPSRLNLRKKLEDLR